MPPGPETEVIEEQTRFRAAESFDYARTVNMKLLQIMNLGRRTDKRVWAVEDLDDLLYSKRDTKYEADIKRLKLELLPNGGEKIINRESYSMGLLRILLSLMDRRELLGRTRIEEEF